MAETITVSLTPDQLRTAYKALSLVPTECRAEMTALFEEHSADWKYQLPDVAYHRMQQLEDRETWAIETLGILGAHVHVHSIPLY